MKLIQLASLCVLSLAWASASEAPSIKESPVNTWVKLSEEVSGTREWPLFYFDSNLNKFFIHGGDKGTRTSYFYTNSFAPFGRTWGAPFMPRARCPIYVAPQPVVCDPFAAPGTNNACAQAPATTTPIQLPAKSTPKPTTFKIKLVTPKPTHRH